jgi:hypothetical protein
VRSRCGRGYVVRDQQVSAVPDLPAPYTYTVDPEERLAYARMWGVVSGADMLRLVRAVHADPRWEDGFDAV